jgi:hypothetical protein
MNSHERRLPGRAEKPCMQAGLAQAHTYLLLSQSEAHLVIDSCRHAIRCLLLIPQLARCCLAPSAAPELLDQVILCDIHQPLVIRLVFLELVIGDAVLAGELLVQVAPNHHAIICARRLLFLVEAAQRSGLAAAAKLRFPALCRECLVHATELGRERAASDGLDLLGRLVRLGSLRRRQARPIHVLCQVSSPPDRPAFQRDTAASWVEGP